MTRRPFRPDPSDNASIAADYRAAARDCSARRKLDAATAYLAFAAVYSDPPSSDGLPVEIDYVDSTRQPI